MWQHSCGGFKKEQIDRIVELYVILQRNVTAHWMWHASSGACGPAHVLHRSKQDLHSKNGSFVLVTTTVLLFFVSPFSGY